MSTYLGTAADDIIDGTAVSESLIDGLAGDDQVTLIQGQSFLSGEGNDVITALSSFSGYGLWSVPGEISVNLAEGWALDGYGGTDKLIGVHEVHMPNHGGTVIGSEQTDSVFCFGGNSSIDLGRGDDTVYMWELNSADFKIRQHGSNVTLSNDSYNVTLTDVESLRFSDRNINLAVGMTDGEVFVGGGNLYSFQESEMSPGWWYENVYNEPQIVTYFPQGGTVVDIEGDGDLDIVVPMNRGYRSGVDTRYHFQVFENRDGNLEYSETLTQATPFIAGSRRTETIFIERYQTDAIVTIAHDTAIETETRTDIPWRLGDISITRLDDFTQITEKLVPENTLPDSDYVNRYSAVNAHSMAVGDINCDGMDDILVGNFGLPFALLQTDSGEFEYFTDPTWTELIGSYKDPDVPNATAAFPLDLDIADYNGDGYDDILWGRGHGTTLSRIIFNDGAGDFSFDNSTSLPVSVYGSSDNLHLKTFSEDFDADGDTDIVVLNSRQDPVYGGNYLQYLTNTGYGVFVDETVERLIDPMLYPDTFLERLHWTDFWQVIDIDGDDDLDIVGATAEWHASKGVIFRNDSHGIFSYESIANGSSIPIAWGDFDQDGALDALTFGTQWNDLEGFSTYTFGLSTVKEYDSSVSRAFDVDGNAGKTVKTIAAILGAERLEDKSIVGVGLSLFDQNMSLEAVCGLALNYVGATTDEQVVDLLYANLLGDGEAPSAAEAQPYLEMLEQKVFSHASLAAAAAELTDDLGIIDLAGLAATGIEYI